MTSCLFLSLSFSFSPPLCLSVSMYLVLLTGRVTELTGTHDAGMFKPHEGEPTKGWRWLAVGPELESSRTAFEKGAEGRGEWWEVAFLECVSIVPRFQMLVDPVYGLGRA